MWEPSPPPVELIRSVPQPANLWIEAAPRWAGRRDLAWIDLRTLDLGGVGRARGARIDPRTAPPGVVYLPLAEAADRAATDELVAWCGESGVAVCVHALPGSAPEGPAAGNGVVDLLAVLLVGETERLDEVASGASVIWPLIAGLTDRPDLVAAGLDRLAARGVASVIPVLPSLGPRTRRRLSERVAEALGAPAGERVFERLFHRDAADPRAFSRRCAERGLDFLPRPLRPPGGDLAGPTRAAAALAPRVAAELELIAELLPVAGGTEPEAQALYRAARWVRRTDRDVRSLWREGNLGVVPWIDPRIEGVIDELARGAPRSTLLAELARAVSAPPANAG